MSNSFIVTFRIEHDETYDKVLELFKYQSYKKRYWRGLVPPNHVEYEIGPLSDTGVRNWDQNIKDTGCRYQIKIKPYVREESATN